MQETQTESAPNLEAMKLATEAALQQATVGMNPEEVAAMQPTESTRGKEPYFKSSWKDQPAYELPKDEIDERFSALHPESENLRDATDADQGARSIGSLARVAVRTIARR